MEQGNGSGRRERRDAQRNLERVLSAAHELFAERGADVTMEEVARHAGVGVGTIYRRFPSKEQLLAAVSHAACDDTRACLVAAADAAADPLQKLRALVLAQYRRAADGTALIELRSPAEGQGGAAAEQQLYDTLHALLRDVIGEGQRQGLLRPGDASMLAALCLELISPRVFAHLARACDGTGNPADQIVGFVLGGLGAQPAAHRRIEEQP